MKARAAALKSIVCPVVAATLAAPAAGAELFASFEIASAPIEARRARKTTAVIAAVQTRTLVRSVSEVLPVPVAAVLFVVITPSFYFGC